jgi:hypothetical protein
VCRACLIKEAGVADADAVVVSGMSELSRVDADSFVTTTLLQVREGLGRAAEVRGKVVAAGRGVEHSAKMALAENP